MSDDRPYDSSDSPRAARPKGRASASLTAAYGPLLAGGLVVWAVGLVVAFVEPFGGLFAPVLVTARTLALATACLVAYSVTGHRVLRRLTPHVLAGLRPLEAVVVEAAVGVGLFVAALFALGVVGLLREEAAWTLLALGLVGAWRGYLQSARQRLRWARRRLAGGRGRAALLAMGVMTLVCALTPATSQDALVYHLSVPARYIAEGGIVHVEGNFYASFPQNVDLLFTFGLLLDGETLAKWHHWMLGAASVIAVIALAERLLRAGSAAASASSEDRPAAALLGGALLATAPTAALIGTWAYIDLGVVFFTLVSTLLFLRWVDTSGMPEGTSVSRSARATLVLAAVVAGLAAGCKYTGGAQGVFVGVGAAATVALRRRSATAGVAPLALVGAVSLLVASPWFVKNLVFTGNPVFPFAWGLFGGEGWDAQRSAVLALSLQEWGGGRAGWKLLTLPWDVSVSGTFFSQQGFDGVIGVAFLLTAPLVLVSAWRSAPARVVLGLAIAHAVAWVATTHQVRFLLPALALFAAVVPAALAAVHVSCVRRVLGVALSVVLVLNTVLFGFHFASRNPLPVLVGLETRESFLEREVPGGDYAVFRYIAERLPESSFVLFGSCGNPGFLCKRPYYSDALFENRSLVEMLSRAELAETFRDEVAERGFTHLIFRFENVFDPSGRRSEIPLEGQIVLADYLNRFGVLLCEANGTRLYELRSEPVQGTPEARGR